MVRLIQLQSLQPPAIQNLVIVKLQPFSKWVNLYEIGALSIQ